MKYGYCSITNQAQSLDFQQEKIKTSFPDCKIILSSPSQKDVLNEILKELKEGDSLIITDLFRLLQTDITFDTDFDITFNTVYKAYQDVFNKGADIIILSSPVLNSDLYRKAILNNYSNQTIAAVDELSRKQIRLVFREQFDHIIEHRNSIKSSIKTSGRKPGLKKGTKLVTRKEVEAKEYLKANLKEFGGTKSNIEALKETGLSRNTFYKYKRELLQKKSTKTVKADDIPDAAPETDKRKKQKVETQSKKKDSPEIISGQMSITDFL